MNGKMTVDARAGTMPAIPPRPRPAEYQRLAREIHAVERPELGALRVAVLSSSTLEFLKPVLIVEGAREGYAVDLFLGEFGQLEQPVLDPDGPLYASPKDVLVLIFQPGDLVPDALDRYYATGGSELDSVCRLLIDRLTAAAKKFRDTTAKPVLIANFATPAALPLGPFDAGDPRGLTHRLAAQNLALAERVQSEADIYVWDYAGLVRSAGTATWSDPRLQMLARATVGSERRPAMAKHLLRTMAALRRRPAKCLVLDLDNTLWGGVIGDDGLEGIQLGDDWPGNPYKAFQRTVLGLRDRGILLAVASKNDESVAVSAFKNHPEMLIDWDDLAAVRINWGPKSVSMRSIATELNIGIDSLVLFDDNPVERAEVRAAVPEAGVIEVPTDPIRYRDALLDSGYFDQLGLSSEDRERADMYRVERQRSILKDEAPSLDDFLRSLEMEAEVAAADVDTLGRIAQLVGKTNQFNLTTRRHSPADLGKMAESDDAFVGWLRLRDRFGDQGLISVGILKKNGTEATLDTFLMSCRVMNRGVENAMMAFLIEQATAMGCDRIIGEYRPTAKNRMVESLLRDLGFAPRGRRRRERAGSSGSTVPLARGPSISTGRRRVRTTAKGVTRDDGRAPATRILRRLRRRRERAGR